MSEHRPPPHAASQGADGRVEELVERAFHYRGDITVSTDEGGSLTGYLFNRNTSAAEPFVQLFETGTGREVSIPYRTIADVRLTGRDAAAASVERFEAFQDRQDRTAQPGTRAE